MTIILCIGGFLFFVEKKKFLAWGLFGAAILQEVLLAMTYSRGGYIALIAGILFVWGLSRNKWTLSFLVSFLVIILLTANGIDRVKSIGITEDGSISNRFLLWEGGLALIWNNMFSGVGADSVGKLYTAWYQPLSLSEAYATLINDYLTIAAAYGIFAIFAYLALILSGLWFGFRLWKTTRNPLLLSLLGAMIAYLANACFTTFYCHWKVYWLFCLLFIANTVFIGVACYLKKFRIAAKDILVPSCTALGICFAMLLGGFIVDRQIPYSIDRTICQIDGKAIDLSKAYPRTTTKAIVVYLYSSDTDSYEKAVRRIARPLLAKGYAVFPVGVSSGLDGLQVAKSVLQDASRESAKNKCKLFLMGQGDGAKHAIVAASSLNSTDLNAVVALGSPASWPFDEISPNLHVKDIKIPLLLVHDKNDELYPYTDSIALKNLCDKYGVPASLEIVEGIGSLLNEKKVSVIDRVDTFLSEGHVYKKQSLAKVNNRLTGKDL